jgi:hypothetical protein
MADTLIAGNTLVEKESRSIGDVPIGGVVAWLANLAGVPNLPSGWLLCDGSTVIDALSSMNGTTIPDLNGDNKFLRGADTAGGTGGADSNSHTHTIPVGSRSDVAVTGAITFVTDVGPSTNSASANDNKPPYYDVVWIMRVR